MTDEWKQQLPEDVQGWDEVKNSDSPEKFWQQIKTTRSYVGQSLRVPGPDAGPEDLAKFHEKLRNKVPGLIPAPNDEASTEAVLRAMGLPEKPDDYEPVEGLEDEVLADLRRMSHQGKLTKTQFKALAAEIKAQTEQQKNTRQAKLEEHRNALQQVWGAALDARKDEVLAMLQATKAPEQMQEMVANLTATPEAMQWLHSLAGRITAGEGRNFGNGDSGQPKGALSPSEASQRISEIWNNKNHPFHRKGDPGHAAAVKQYVELVAYSKGLRAPG